MRTYHTLSKPGELSQRFPRKEYSSEKILDSQVFKLLVSSIKAFGQPRRAG